VVNIEADVAPEGQVFDKWIGQTDHIGNIYLPYTVIVMPLANTEITATYRDQGGTTYALTVTNGDGDGVYLPGEVVNIVADRATSGQVFDKWVGQTSNVANINLPNTSIRIPFSPVTVIATYRTQGAIYTLTVNSGEGSGSYPSGSEVNIAANSEFMGKAPAANDTTGAANTHVLEGKTFWGLKSGTGWGLKSGDIVTRTLSDANDTVVAGYYAATTLHDVDLDLVTGNIKSGANIFGVLGTSTVVDTAGATAANTDIFTGKTAYVSGNLVTGNVAEGANVTGTVLTMPIPDGLYSGSKTATASNTNLTTANIRSGVSIFGVTGTFTTTATGAANTDILKDKTAYVNGSLVTGTAAGARVPRTGQTLTVPLNPAPPGSDGALQKGVTWPALRFTDNGNGTVTDNLTGLIWLKTANCFGLRQWDAALSDCNGLASPACGLNDSSIAGHWRLPNIRELQSLTDYAKTSPALPTSHPFADVDLGVGVRWSSTSRASDTGDAWAMELVNGHAALSDKTTQPAYVWPVSGGQ
jgi:hypothetical protein